MKQTVIGHHMDSSYGITNAARLLLQLGGNAIQVNITNPADNTINNVDDDDIAELSGLREQFQLYVVVHGKFIYNFCRPASSIQWQRKSLIHEMTHAAKLGADLVIHQGKNVLGLPRNEALANYVSFIEQALAATPRLTNKILLENSCQQGTEMGYTVRELADIYQRFSPANRSRIGFCIDTCHIFVAGELDMEISSIDDFFQQFQSLIGLEHLKVVHLNDSAVPFDGHNDSHANIGAGHIPIDGLKHFVNKCHQLEIPMILETPSTKIIGEIEFVHNATGN
jgi:deoxyribonuclease IV